jgi:hypothetical protein
LVEYAIGNRAILLTPPTDIPKVTCRSVKSARRWAVPQPLTANDRARMSTNGDYRRLGRCLRVRASLRRPASSPLRRGKMLHPVGDVVTISAPLAVWLVILAMILRR